MPYIEKKKVNDREYLYLAKNVRVSGNKWKKIRKYLGKNLDHLAEAEKALEKASLTGKRPFIKFTSDGGIGVFPWDIVLTPFIIVAKQHGVDTSDSFYLVEDNIATFYVNAKTNLELGNTIYRKLQEKAFFNRVVADHKRFLADQEKLSQKLLRLNPRDLSTNDLKNLLIDWREKFINVFNCGAIIWFIDYTNTFFSKGLTELVEQRIKEKGLDLNAQRVYQALISPTKPSFAKLEQLALFKLACQARQSKSLTAFLARTDDPKASIIALEKEFPSVFKKLKRLHQDFCWIYFNYSGPEMGLSDYLENLRELVKEKDLKEKEARSRQELALLKKEQKGLAKKLGLSPKEKRLFELGRELFHWKDYRKIKGFYSFYAFHPYRLEMARRLFISPEQLNFLSTDELLEIFEGKGKLDLSEVNQRAKACICSWDKPARHFKAFTQPGKLKEFKKKVKAEKVDLSVEELKGTPACLGKAEGKVKLVFSQKDNGKVEAGDILVSQSTNPTMLPAMKKAAAIVTDQGGITCHAAIVSRELGIPCVIGTNVATKVFKDGEKVFVDANHGMIRRL